MVFFEGKLVKIKTGPLKGKIKVNGMGEKLPGGGKAPKYFNNVDEAKAAIKKYIATEGRAALEFKKSFSGVTKKTRRHCSKSLWQIYERIIRSWRYR